MSETSTHNTAFTAPESPELPDYRPVNIFCLLALCSAVLSPFALVHPLLLVFPIVAVLVAVIALRTISPEQVGRTAAVIALVIAPLFAGWGLSHYFSRHHHLFNNAETFANRWLDKVSEGRLTEAHQLTLVSSARVSEEVSLEEYYAEPTAEMVAKQASYSTIPAIELEAFVSEAPLNRMTGADGFDYALEDRLSVRYIHGERTDVSLVYHVQPRNGEPIELLLTLERYLREHTAFWRIKDIGETDAEPDSVTSKKRDYYVQPSDSQ
jgi:hypothetical protein